LLHCKVDFASIRAELPNAPAPGKPEPGASIGRGRLDWIGRTRVAACFLR
jgi:hypothetical protein